MKTFLLLCVVLFAPAALFAQPLPAVHGRVYGQDEKGANLGPVPGAKIELLSAKSGTVIATATADSPGGYFQIKDLPHADYAYRVTAAGFKTEDEKRGFKVPQTSLEYVHDFLLTRPPPKRERCDVPVLVVKRVSIGTNDADTVRLPAASASLLLRPNSPKIATPPNQPFVSSAKGDLLLKDLAVGDYSVAIEAPDAQPFIGTLQVKCDSADQIVFELQPCDAVLHSFVRTLLREGWGRTPAAKAPAQAYQAAARGAGPNPALDYARALSQLSAGSYDDAMKSLAATIARKPGTVTARASEMQLWMSLVLHQPAQALRDARSWSKQLSPDTSASPAARDTAYLCGIALGLVQGPWKPDVPAGESVLFERDLLAALPGDLRPQVEKARDSVTATFAKLKAGADSERGRIAAEAGDKMKAAIARIEDRQTAIENEVAQIDAELQGFQGMAQAGDQSRIQIIGFSQQRQALAVQMRSLQARLQQLAAMMSQTRQMPPTPQPRLPQKNGQRSTSPTFVPQQPTPQPMNPQLQNEMRQIQTQLAVLQNQDAQLAARQVNAQNQSPRPAGASPAGIEAKLKRREALAQESAMLDQQLVDSSNGTPTANPEATGLARRARLVKTYHDLPLEDRRQELLKLFNCGAAKEDTRPAANAQPVEILEKDFPSQPVR
jgi:hypothetical protein